MDEERLRVYVTALVDGCEWRGGNVTGWLAKHTQRDDVPQPPGGADPGDDGGGIFGR